MQTLLELAIQKQLKTFSLELELSLKAEQGQVLVLFGPSGSGKTMTLRCIAGVTEPDAGFISIAGRPVFDSRAGINITLSARRVGYLPQNYGLFPHLTVAQNIAFGLFSWEKKRANSRAQALVSLMQLEGLEKRYPRQLSGGQQQRVAFARALAPEPAILLLDEPFSALDAAIRAELRQNLASLSRELKLPVVFITHDLEEAYILADQVAVYGQGRILQYSSRAEVFNCPATPEVARLVGISNLWQGLVQHFNSQERLVQLDTNFGKLWAQLPANRPLPLPGARLTVCFRPERIMLRFGEVVTTLEAEATKYHNYFRGWLVAEVAKGSRYSLFFRLERPAQFGGSLYLDNSEPAATLRQPHDLELEIGSQDYAQLRQSNPANWQLEISPAALHLIYP